MRTEYQFPPAEYLADVEEPLPAANTIGAKLDNRIDLRAAFRQLRSQLRSAREWVACMKREAPPTVPEKCNAPIEKGRAGAK